MVCIFGMLSKERAPVFGPNPVFLAVEGTRQVWCQGDGGMQKNCQGM